MPSLSRPRRIQLDVLLALRVVFEPDALVSPGIPGPACTLGFRGRTVGVTGVWPFYFKDRSWLLKQLFDLVGHARLIRTALARVCARAGWSSIAIGFHRGFMDGESSLGISTRELERLDLVMLTKSRGLGELAMEQGCSAALTPLRDVAGLADNLPLLIIAAILVFRASFDLPGWGTAAAGLRRSPIARLAAHWLVDARLGCAALYALYRIVARLAGSGDLPLGNCLVARGCVHSALDGGLRRLSAGVALDRAAQRRA